jgi:hypothetical protein
MQVSSTLERAYRVMVQARLLRTPLSTAESRPRRGVGAPVSRLTATMDGRHRVSKRGGRIGGRASDA